MNKAKILGYGFALLSTGALAIVTTPHEAKGEFDIPALNRQVQTHEKRIGDLETKTDQTDTKANQTAADVYIIQQETSIAPAEPVAPTQTPVAQAEEPTPEPVTVTSRSGPYWVQDGQDPNPYTWYCDYTYSDGSSDTQVEGHSNSKGIASNCSKNVGSQK